MRILGIESSCDETGVAIYGIEGLLANTLHSQIDLHADYGGVVPELASRDHIQKLLPLTREALKQANLSLSEIDGIAYTAGPGLMGALLVGASFGRSLGFALNKPTIAIHHLEAHILAPLLETPAPTFPFLALLVSGGHTLLIHIHAMGHYQILGETLDDAVGEAFDKTAKLLGLSYPGGAALAKLAEQGDPKRFHFPRPMLDRPGLDFSFSGLKTHARQVLQANSSDAQTKADIARAFEEAVVATLTMKCKRACNETGLKQVVVAGGVGANQCLRNYLSAEIATIGGKVFFPRLEFCTDNAAMVALAGFHRLRAGQTDKLEINVDPRWSIESLLPCVSS